MTKPNHFAQGCAANTSVKAHQSLAAIALHSAALPIAIAMLAATLLAYFLFYDSVKQHHMNKLMLFSKERAHYELRLFELARDNLELIKNDLTTLLEKGSTEASLEHLNQRIEKKPDGSYRNRGDQLDTIRETQLFIPQNKDLSSIASRTLAYADQLLFKYGPAWSNRFINTYFLGQEDYSSCFWHGESFIFNLEQHFTHLDKPYFQIGTPEKNPDRSNRWTSVYLDDASGKWMVSSITPVYDENRFLGVFGHDIYLDDLIARTITDRLQETKNMLMTRDGQLIAHPDYMEQVQRKGKSLIIAESGNTDLQTIYSLVSQEVNTTNSTSTISPKIINDEANGRYLVATPLPLVDWLLVTEYPERIVIREAAKSARTVFLIGAILLLIELITLFYIIKIKVSKPLGKLGDAATSLKYGTTLELLEKQAQRNDEVGQLSREFITLQNTINKQFDALHQQVDVRKNAEQSLQKKREELSLLNSQLDREVRARTSDLHREIEAISKLSAAMEHAAESIAIMNNKMVIEYINPSFEKHSGYRKEELLGRTPMAVEWSRSDHSVQQDILSTIGKGEIWSGIVNHEAKNGEVRYEEITISPIKNQADIITHYVEVKRDITERLALEAQLQNTQKLESIGQLAAGIAHEINTPTQYIGNNTCFLKEAFTELTQLIGQLNSLPDKNVSDAVQQLLEEADVEYLQEEVPIAIAQCLEGIERVSKIVHAMKNFSNQTKDKTAVDLNQAIQSTITVATNEWKYTADLVTDFDPDMPPIYCEPGEINQVVLNMIVNAAHAINDARHENKGLIEVATHYREGLAEIHIVDNGTGMSQSVKEQIFDPFFTTKEVGKGTGQGLSIAHSVIVKNHGGSITLDTQPGKGSHFIIRLPISEATQPSHQEAALASRSA